MIGKSIEVVNKNKKNRSNDIFGFMIKQKREKIYINYSQEV